MLLRKIVCVFFMVLVSGFSVPVLASDAKSILAEIKADFSAELSHIREREAKFKADLSSQQSLLAKAKAEVLAQEKRRDSMKEMFDTNETTLIELTALLERRSGDLGELFGVFRQTAGDTQSMLYDSLVSLQYPERTATVDALAAIKSVPAIEEIQSLWSVLLDEVLLSGEVAKFETDIVKPDGSQSLGSVVRIGAFNVVSNDKYLIHLPESSKVVELTRQPAGHILSSAATISGAAASETVPFYVDPSRGVLLGLLVQSPSLMERIEQGRIVGYAIIALTIIGLLIVIQRLLALQRIGGRISRQQKNMSDVSSDNPLGRALAAFYENKHLSVDVISRKLDEVIFKDVTEIRKGLSTVKVLAAVAPLMGLLGTVTGMIGTFQAITLFGTGDPKLMAGGISQALVTTVLGLVGAIPLLLSHSILSGKATSLTKILGEQAAGMVAEQAKAIEQKK